MERRSIQPRPNWQEKVESLGFGFHTLDSIYWDETAYYAFTLPQIETLEKATNELWEMCLEAVEYVIEQGLYEQFHIPDFIVPLIERTWEDDAPSIYGRFDFSYDGINPPKLLEFNADTPTSLFEAAVVQWNWLQDCFPQNDQFNSIHDKLIAYWASLKPYLHRDTLYFTCYQDNLEDLTTTEYLRDCAMQAGLPTSFIDIQDIGWLPGRNYFTDLEERPLRNIFKLYPYEWLIHEDFGLNLLQDTQQAHWIEPAWKMILSNKAILPILWQLFPEHPNLLPSFFQPLRMSSYAKKPILSREGANVELVENGKLLAQTQGEYGEEGYIYQGLHKLPNFQGHHPLIGSWVIGQEAAGIGIREANSLITDNTSRFIPHLII
jgi:glutathionylspermidine synthase